MRKIWMVLGATVVSVLLIGSVASASARKDPCDDSADDRSYLACRLDRIDASLPSGSTVTVTRTSVRTVTVTATRPASTAGSATPTSRTSTPSTTNSPTTASPTASPTPRSTTTGAGSVGTWWSGQSDASTTKDGSFAAWRGRDVEIVGLWAATYSAQDAIDTPRWNVASPSQYPQFAAYVNATRLDYAFGALLDGESWAKAAAGAYDSRWIDQLDVLRSSWGNRPAGAVYLRFAHEFNGSWYPWRVTPADTANFKAAWVRWAGLARQHFPGARIVWCPNAGSSYEYDVRTLYPGDPVVDVIGVDQYNFWPWANTAQELQAKWEATDRGGPRGPETFRRFAAEHGKPMALPEWGNDSRAGDASGGGDSPAFIAFVHDWLLANGSRTPAAGKVEYEIYFNVPGYGDSLFSLYPEDREPGNTQAAATYRQLW